MQRGASYNMHVIILVIMCHALWNAPATSCKLKFSWDQQMDCSSIYGELTVIHVCMQLSQWLRLGAMWDPGSQIMSTRVTEWGKEGWMCRIYLCISMGLLQPLFLLTTLLLCLQSIRPPITTFVQVIMP